MASGALRVWVAHAVLAFALILHGHKLSTSEAASSGSMMIEENVDVSVEPCDAFENCVRSLKQMVGGRMQVSALIDLEACLIRSVLECPGNAAPWFGLAAVVGAMGNATKSSLLCKTGHRLSKPPSQPRDGRTPLVSIVLAGRADSYRGDPMKRACLGLKSIALNAIAVRLPVEVVFVDYNPATGRSVVDILSACIENVPRAHNFLNVRVVTVPLWILQISAAVSARGELLEFNEMVAKNVGIRRASGTYILCSNPEVVLPSSLWRQFTQNPRAFFRTSVVISSDRRDSWASIDADRVGLSEMEEKLDAGVRVVWCHLQENGTTLPRATDRGLAPHVYFNAVHHAVANCPWQDCEVQQQGNGTKLAAMFTGLPATDSAHHTAAGDFIMAHRAVWHRVRGFFDVWSLQRPPIDSLTVTKMLFGLNMRQMVLRGQYAVWHYSDEPFKYNHDHELIDIGKHNRVSDVPATLTMFFFFKWISRRRRCALAAVNSCTWGMCTPFAALELPFTAERLFRCGGNSADSCMDELKEFSRMCPRTVQFPIRGLDFVLMPALQLIDEDMGVAAAIVNFGCLMAQRNKCADDEQFADRLRFDLSSNSCCSNIESMKVSSPSSWPPHVLPYLQLEGELRCGHG
jgi:hypothetical protein